MAALYYESQICHHGIKGQRWGIRRFQRLDGSLTRAGELRYEGASGSKSRRKPRSLRREAKRQQAQRNKLELEKAKNAERMKTAKLAKKVSDQEQQIHELNKSVYDTRSEINEKPTSKKSISEMSDQELLQMVNRLKLEQTYADLLNPKVPPPPPGFGHKMAEALGKAVIGGVSGAAQDVIKSGLKSAFGVNDKKDDDKKDDKKDDDKKDNKKSKQEDPELALQRAKNEQMKLQNERLKYRNEWLALHANAPSGKAKKEP